MCETKTISRLSFILFIILQNYLMFNYYFLSESIRVNKQMGYLIFIIILIVSFILLSLLPKKLGLIKYFDILKKSFLLKYIFVIAKSIILFMTILVGVRTLSIALFPDINYLLFSISLIVGSIIVSCYKVENIINTSCILFIIGLILMIFPLFLNINLKDISLLLPIETITNFSTLSCIYLLLDSITLLFLNDGITIKKKDIVIGVVILFSICIIETLNVITLCGVNYLNNNEFLGFFSLYIQDTLTYVGNLSFIYIYLIPCVCIFKSALSIAFIKKTLSIKKVKLFNVITFTLLIISVILFQNLGKELITYLIYTTIILLTPIYLFFISNRSVDIEITI